VLRPHAVRLLDALPLADARRVLDLGTGVGALLPDIACAAPRASLFGIDIALGCSLSPGSWFPWLLWTRRVSRSGQAPSMRR